MRVGRKTQGGSGDRPIAAKCFYTYCPGESCRARGCPNRCRHPQCTGRYPRRVCTPVVPSGFWASLTQSK